jgi:hypothetical protein
VAVALTWPLFRHAPPAHPVADSTAAPKSSPAVAREIEGDELALLDDAGKTYRHLASRAAGAIDDVAQFVSPGGNAPSAVENNSDSRPVWIEELRPIGKSLADAFDFLWQAGAGEDGSRT